MPSSAAERRADPRWMEGVGAGGPAAHPAHCGAAARLCRDVTSPPPAANGTWLVSLDSRHKNSGSERATTGGEPRMFIFEDGDASSEHCITYDDEHDEPDAHYLRSKLIE